MRAIVVGAGIAGLSTAIGLARRGVQVTVLERREVPCAGASGFNAAIYRPLESARVMTALARRHALLLDVLLGHRTAWLDARGLVFTGGQTALRQLAFEANRAGLRAVPWARRELERRIPVLTGGTCASGLWLGSGGVIDLHRVARALVAECEERGVDVRCRGSVSRLARTRGGQWVATTGDGGEVSGEVVVMAAGAQAGALAASVGSSVALQVFKRSLVLLQPDGVDLSSVVWHVSAETYFRAESGGVLASPCDEVPSRADATPVVSQDDLVGLAQKLTAVAPGLRASTVRRAWAGLRTFSDDGLPIIGADPHVSGLWWCAALGGSGMTTGVALGDLAAYAVLGGVVPQGLAASRLSNDGGTRGLVSRSRGAKTAVVKTPRTARRVQR